MPPITASAICRSVALGFPTSSREERHMSDLLKINVNEHTEKKGGLTYLSWAWAWAEVLKVDPRATWVVHQYGAPGEVQPCMWIGETAMVHTTVTVNGVARECLLPVMDNRNNAVKKPDARKISDAIMRCMTKAIAMHGLGLYIYAGEDLPESDEPAAEAADADQPNSLTAQLKASLAKGNLKPER
jgi:acetylornithine deacetylase/succinyl-diaminopimelate desuccinylase-like protein